jgi:hypothetical protein
MWTRSYCKALLFALGVIWLASGAAHADDARDAAIERAVDYLAREVRAWPRDKGCFSCHNNGDGVRALHLARASGFDVPQGTLTESTNWLRTPEKWQADSHEEPFKDPKLATVQFAAALAELQAVDGAGEGGDQGPLATAAAALAEFQGDDGAWHIDHSGLGGSPITYGDALATVLSRRTLLAADRDRFAAEIAAADRWLRSSDSQRIVDAAAIMWGLAGEDDAAAREQQARCLQLILRGQAKSGGWGLFTNRETEAFDTAIAILALGSVEGAPVAADDVTTQVQAAIDRGCAYLIATQSPDGSWPETTRPAGGHSYAHRVSTTAWAAVALLTASPPVTKPTR